MDQEKILICLQEHSAVENLDSKLINSGFSVAVSKPDFNSVISLASKSNPHIIIISVNLDSKFSGIEAVLKINMFYGIYGKQEGNFIPEVRNVF